MKSGMSRRSLLVVGAVSAMSPSGLGAAPTRTDAQVKDDWPWLGRYAAENEALKTAGGTIEIVFLGDSITQNWRSTRPGFFRRGWIGRGISGQTTPQMLLRMMADVVALKPRYLHILGGTNDVAQNTGPISADATAGNIRMMTYVARQESIRVLIGAIPPAADFPWRGGLDPAGKIMALNEKLKSLADETRALWIDYHGVLSDGKGGMDTAFTADGVHPNPAGYSAMEDVFLKSAPRRLVKAR